MKTFKMSPLNTEEGSSPPPPPAPADPSGEAANAAVAAAAAAAAAAEGVATQYSDMYPTYNSYLMTRYSDQRYHTPTTYTYGGAAAGGSHISAHAASDSYYRYPEYSSRYPYSSANSSTCTTTGGGGGSGTSPRWRRRSYDPDYITNRRPGGGAPPVISGVGTSNSRPLSDMASAIANPSSSSSVLMRSRSRSRVGSSDYDTTGGSSGNYLRYVSPSASSYATTTRPMSGYIYGHSYVPSTSTLDSSVSTGGGPRLGSAPPASSQQPQPPPNYNAMDREVSARIRRYQADPSS